MPKSAQEILLQINFFNNLPDEGNAKNLDTDLTFEEVTNAVESTFIWSCTRESTEYQQNSTKLSGE